MAAVKILRVGAYFGTAAAILLGTWMIRLHVRHWLDYGHLAPLALHADVVVHNASIGIPGITKMYEARLTNLGIWPVSVERCSYLSDTGFAGTMVAYNIDKWDAAARQWTRTVEFAKPEFCTPVPLGMGNTRWRHAWLWPGQSLSTEEEATGAREPFKKGDTLRFVVVSDVTGKGARSHVFPTSPFRLDEERLDNETPFRVRH